MAFQVIIVAWLRWRYGGDVDALKPPLGYHVVYAPRPLTYMIAYHLKYALWRAESALFERYGQPMRAAWKASLAT